MRVIGTAGHVDHGKSTLVRALTGINPDRLREEQLREMTIDLGFAWLKLPGGEDVGIVDVPGHRDFIENMLAGVGGIDAALFVIAADEGIMPQTREHLAILDILQVRGGVIALTKVDMVDDPEWLDLVEEEVRQKLAGTVLGEAEIIRVSARTGQGLDMLKSALQVSLGQNPPRPDLGRPRLPIDRVFSMPGFGTVVTGTLVDGCLNVGDEVVLLPSGKHGRVRGLQTHKRKEDQALPGTRTAVNISGIDSNEAVRGEVLTLPEQYRITQRIDVQFRLLRDVATPLHHNMDVKFFLGTAEVQARLRLLGAEELLPGEEGWLQLELAEPVVAVRGDRYILRRPSPGETLGGGQVVDPQPAGRHKRFEEEVLQQLESLQHGTPEEVLLQACSGLGTTAVKDVVLRARLSPGQAGAALKVLLESGQIVALEPGEMGPGADLLVVAGAQYAAEVRKVQGELEQYHKTHPLRRGVPREELKSRLKIQQTRVYNAFLRKWAADGLLVENRSMVWLPQHKINFSPTQQLKVKALLQLFTQSPYSPPSVKECIAQVGEDIYSALVDLEELIQVSNEVVFQMSDYKVLVETVMKHLEEHETITVAEFRDHFNTSRRYALGLLEHLDSIGITQRDGDLRRVRSH